MNRRARLDVRGAVQGVGFRPFVYRLAREASLAGWVRNTAHGAELEVEGAARAIDELIARLRTEPPPPANVRSIDVTEQPVRGDAAFAIRPSAAAGAATATVLPDIATCEPCRAEVLTPGDRRFRYPFTNCSHCGPRYSIVTALPYDRANTTMARFALCRSCRAEYEDPGHRRFHAQANACPACGPKLALWDARGRAITTGDSALRAACAALAAGAIVAVKGLGGFHLMALATDPGPVANLRARKRRPAKPLAVLFGSAAQVAASCEPSADELALLRSAQAPIALVRRRPGGALAAEVAPDNPLVGAMLPYSPLHLLLARDVGAPLVATSGNLTDEPICTDEREAVRRLAGVADLFLVHDRPIARPVDDSVVRVVAGRPLLVRRGRGYAPLPIPLRTPATGILAVGGHLKAAVALAVGGGVALGQHIGDLDTPEAADAHAASLADLPRLYGVEPARVARDAHPDYGSTRAARRLGLPERAVYHHHAHVLACAADNDAVGPLLGVAWDGTGLGPDGTIWGGEWLRVDGARCERVAHLRAFRIPGGDRAAREPRRSALGALAAAFGPAALEMTDLPPVASFTRGERAALAAALERGVNAPLCSSAGRLFDAVAALCDLRQLSTFEAEAAAALEFAAARGGDAPAYPTAGDRGAIDWHPLLRAVVADLRAGVATATIAARFHAALAATITRVAVAAGADRVALTGGCFQNGVLLTATIAALRGAGICPLWHRDVPTNDGGLALGQIVAALHDEDHHVSRDSRTDH